MLIRPDAADLRLIGFFTGRIVTGLGLLQLVPLVVAVPLREWNTASALVIGASVALIVGRWAEVRLFTRDTLDWSHGMVTVALSWLIGPAFVAIPFYLSGHFGGYLDALFDAMSGLTTSGLTLLADLDHVSRSLNLLRHLTHFAGGQGIVIVVLTVLAGSGAQIGTLYVGEGRDERIVPNVIRTARFIYLVATAYLLVGTLALWAAALTAGLQPASAAFHAVNLFMAAFDTGGFSPNSTSIAYYHSFTMEAVIAVLMVAGTLSFGLHFQLWRGRRREVIENLEMRSLAISTAVLIALVLAGLGRVEAYTQVPELFRKGVFTLLSAHTGTGFGVIPARLYVTEWGFIAPAAVVAAMALGGMASSTAGGIKAIRVGLATKSLLRDIRRVVAPDAALVVSTYHARSRRLVTDGEVRGAITILMLFLVSYGAGAIVGVLYGYEFDQALFESTSAGANVGLSIGIVGPALPAPLKLTYLLQMWLGRLEFLSAFALVGYLVALVRGRL